MSRKDSFRSQTEFNSTKLLQFEKYQLEDTPPRIITEWTLVTDSLSVIGFYLERFSVSL